MLTDSSKTGLVSTKFSLLASFNSDSTFPSSADKSALLLLLSKKDGGIMYKLDFFFLDQD